MPIENYIFESNPLTDPIGTLNRQIQANNQWNAEQAQKQMDFQREMSDTAHQREIADLKAAGLNPVLSARLGGASTPSGAMAQSDSSGVSGLVDLLTMSMETANTAALAAARSAGGSSGVSGSNSGANIFGLDPANYRIKNPSKPWQLAWNAAVDAASALGIQIDVNSLASMADTLGLNEEQRKEVAEQIDYGDPHNSIPPAASQFVDAYRNGKIPHNEENKDVYNQLMESYYHGAMPWNQDGKIHPVGTFWASLLGDYWTGPYMRKGSEATVKAAGILAQYGLR